MASLRAFSGMELSTTDVTGLTAAHLAAVQGHVNALRCLHELVPKTLSAQDNNGHTPAHGAAVAGHVGVLRCLHQLVPKTLSSQDNNGHMPAHLATIQGHASECATVPPRASAEHPQRTGQQ